MEGRLPDDPYPGLEDYVRAACIVAPWSQVKKIERYERRLDSGQTSLGINEGTVLAGYQRDERGSLG